MTPQEQQMLQGLVGRIQGTQLTGKDNEAEQYIQQSLGGNRDALYVLCQTVLVQQYALDQAQKQLAEAREQLSAAQRLGGEPHTSFLGRIFGSGDPEPPRAAAAQPQYAPVTSSGFAQSPAYGGGAPMYGQPQYVPVQRGGFLSGGMGGSGFLQGAMQTAAGVAAGALAFEGIESLMHGFGHEAGYGSDRALGGFDDRSNFAGDDGGRDSDDSFGNRLQSADNDGGGLSPDIEDRRDSGGLGFLGGDSDPGTSGFADTGDDSSDFGDSGDAGSDGGDWGGDDNS